MVYIYDLMSGYQSSIHLWFTFTDEIDDEALLAKYLTLLPRIEQDSLERFHFPHHRKRYLIGRALLRSVLSAWINIPPPSIRFSRETYGRPYIKPADNSRGIDFNLSYTDGLVALALSVNGKVGIDVENTATDIDVMEIAASCFSAAETEELNSLPAGETQRARFYEFWTMKEAHLKASGAGLNTSLNTICCTSVKRSAGSLQRFPLQLDNNDFCRVGLYDPSARHKAAICVSENEGTSMEVKIKKTIPLVETTQFNLTHE